MANAIRTSLKSDVLTRFRSIGCLNNATTSVHSDSLNHYRQGWGMSNQCQERAHRINRLQNDAIARLFIVVAKVGQLLDVSIPLLQSAAEQVC